jgi:D-cysteine desulfhydrase
VSGAPLAQLDALPRLGWVQEPSPVQADEALAEALGLDWLGFKRDDQLGALHGGSKVRKLDYLLAAPPFRDAPRLSSVGAIGSGHLVALTAATQRLGKALHAHLFWEPTDPSVLESLAYTASNAAEMTFVRTRVGLALRRPGVLTRRDHAGAIVIEPGATHPVGMVGTVRGALELAAQVRAGLLPVPHRLYVPIGSGGTAVGLALGLAWAGLETTVHAVSATEPIYTPLRRARALWGQVQRWLESQGLNPPPWSAGRLRVDHTQVGPGYGIASSASTAACARRGDLPLEPIYSGKTLAALVAAPPRGERVLFWLTPRRAEPLPCDLGWEARLPQALRRRLDGQSGPTRRQWMAAAAAVAAGGLVGWRLTATPALAGFEGQVLGATHAAVLAAAAEALLPGSPALPEIPQRVDRYARALSSTLQGELRLLLTAVEQSGLRPLTAVSPAQRRARFDGMRAAGGAQRLLYRGVRDLCALGCYQQPATWPTLGYSGPLVGQADRPETYGHLIAAPGTPPPGWTT